MNYQHAYHAGNFADVLKHAVLTALITALRQKPAALAFVDTHAGAGCYDLSGPEASKTQESACGIGRLLDAPSLPPTLLDYVDLVHSLNAGASGAVQRYPGSPLIASTLLRDHDRLLLCEVQEAEHAALKLQFARDPRVAVHRRDGYAALKALLPPVPKRGLILIDPPYEAQDAEFSAITAALEPAFKRFAAGVYAVWYPIKLRQHIAPFHRWLAACGMPKVLIAEILLHPDDSALRLNGCGMAIINAPWKLDLALQTMMPALLERLAVGRFGSQRVQWLAGESR